MEIIQFFSCKRIYKSYVLPLEEKLHILFIETLYASLGTRVYISNEKKKHNHEQIRRENV